MAKMPPGFTFKPSEDELVNHYLKRKLYGLLPTERNEAIPDHFIMPETYIYDYDPWELQELFRVQSLAQLDNGECYFFCPRRNKYRKGYEENRATKSGFWKPRGQKTTIRTSEIIAEKRGLTFYQGQQRNAILTKYKMHQYRLVSSNNYVITPKEMPCDLCYIFMKKTKLDQQDNAPICNEGNSSTSIISTANDSEIYISQIQNKHQRDQTIEPEEAYSALPPVHYDTNEIYSTQHNYDVNRELALPSTNYAYAGCYISRIPGEHQGDQTIESEEAYSSQPPVHYDANKIYSTQHNYDVNGELAFPSTNYAYAGRYSSRIPGEHQGDQTIESEEAYSSQPPVHYDANKIYSTQHNYDVNGELAFPSTNYAYAGCYISRIPGEHQGDQSMESKELCSSLPPLTDSFNLINPLELIYDTSRE